MLSDFTSITANVKTMWTDFSSAFLDAFIRTYDEAQGQRRVHCNDRWCQDSGSTLGKVGTAVGILADSFEGFMDIMQPVTAYISQFIESTIEAAAHLFTILMLYRPVTMGVSRGF